MRSAKPEKGSVDAQGLDMVRRSTGSPKRLGQGRWHSSGTPQASLTWIGSGSSDVTAPEA
jgi:hypothetical protein